MQLDFCLKACVHLFITATLVNIKIRTLKEYYLCMFTIKKKLVKNDKLLNHLKNNICDY